MIVSKVIKNSNRVNIPTVRTKTSGSNGIQSKSANIWNYLKLFHSEQLIHQEKFLQIFINRLFYKGLCLTVPLLFIFYSFCFMFELVYVCLISVCFTCSCIYVSHGFILCFLGGGGAVLTVSLQIVKNNTFEEYILMTH